jgi:hypothetical protein
MLTGGKVLNLAAFLSDQHSFIPSCVQSNATWYKGSGNRCPQIYENAGFPGFFINFGVKRSTPVERNLVLGGNAIKSARYPSDGFSDEREEGCKMLVWL